MIERKPMVVAALALAALGFIPAASAQHRPLPWELDAPLRERPAGGPLDAPLRLPSELPVDIVHLWATVTPTDGRGTLDVALFLEMEVVADSLRSLALPVRGLTVRSARLVPSPSEDAAADSLAGPRELEPVVSGDTLFVSVGAIPSGERLVLGLVYSVPEGPALRSTLSRDGSGEAWTPGIRGGGADWLPLPHDLPDRFTAEITAGRRGTLHVLSGGFRDGSRPVFAYDRPVTAQQLVLAVHSSSAVVRPAGGTRIAYFGVTAQDEGLALFHEDLEASLDFVVRATGFVMPYDTLRVVFADPDGAGLSGTGLLVADRALLADSRARLSVDPLPAIAELAARAWTDGMLGASAWTDSWVPEALAWWLSVGTVSSRRGEGAAAAIRHDGWQAYLAETGRYRRPLVWDRWEHPADLLDAHASTRGGSFLHMMHGLIGDAPFRAALRRLFASSSETGADTEDLRAALEGASGRFLLPWFDAYVYGAGHPRLRLDARFDLDAERLDVTVRQIQEGSFVPAVFPAETDLRWMSLMENGSAPVRMADSVWTFSTVTGIEPRYVLLDAEGRLPAEIVHQADLSALTAVVRYGPVGARLHAAWELERFLDDPALPLAIRLAMEQEKQADVRVALTAVAGGIGAGGSLAALVRRAWSDPDARVRVEAVRAARAFAGDPAWESFTRDEATADASGSVQAAAVETLAAMRGNDATYIARSALVTDAYAEAVRRAGFRVLAGDSSLTSIERRRLFLEHTRPDLPVDRILAALELAPSMTRERALADRVQALLDHPSFRVRFAVAQSAGFLLPGRELAGLRGRLEREPDPAVRRALERSLAPQG